MISLVEIIREVLFPGYFPAIGFNCAKMPTIFLSPINVRSLRRLLH